jgi:conjugal transfer ATP-binding protein TraC
LRRIRNNVVGALRGAHFASVTWDVHDLIKFLKEVLNPQQPYDDFMPAYDDGRLIKAQVVNTDTVMTLKNRGDGIVCSSREGNTEIRFMSVKNYPLNWELREMERLIGDFSQMSNRYPCPFMLITGVYVLDHEAIKNMVLVKSARATQNAESPFAKYMPGLQDKKRDWDYVQRVVTEGQTLVSMYMQIMLFTDPKESDVIEQAVKALWRSSGFDLTTDVYVQVQALLSSLPMGLSKDMYADLKKFQRVTTKTSTNAICFTPFLSEWRGTETPTMLVFGKRGQAMRLSLDDNRQGNQNLIVSGASGTGKSFFYNYLMLSYMGAMNARVRHFDIGRSAEKLCNLLGGQMIEFRPEIDMRLNPFSLVVEKDFNEEMALLRPMVAQMAMPNSKPDSLQTAILDEAIRTVWDRKGNDMSVTDIAEYLREMGNKGDVNTDWISKLAERVLPRMHDEHQALHGSQEAEGSNRILPASIDEYKMLLMASTLGNGGSGRDQRMHDLARMLYPYTREGTYGRYFEGRANIDLSNDFVLLEMEELANKKELRSVVLQILIYAIQQELFTGDRSKKTLISIDEAWQLLADTGGSTAEYIENGFRRARKNGGSFVIISQNLYEVAKGDVGAAIMANSDWKILFRQDRDAFNMLLDSKRFNANETEQRIISTLQTEQGVFSEAFVRMGNNQSGVFSFWPDPFMKLLFSSNAQDYAQINQYRERGFPVTEAIHQVLKDRGIHA